MQNASQILKDNLVAIVDIARFAPSVHNSQPWKISLHNDQIRIDIDKKHMLKEGDPTGRATYISLGILCEALLIAAQKYGLVEKGINLSDTGATVTFAYTKHIGPNNEAEAALKSRCTDRSIYKKATIGEQLINKIIASAHDLQGIHMHVMNSPEDIKKIAEITSKGISLALTNPSFRAELSSYLYTPWSKTNRGISVKALYIPRLIAYLEPKLLKAGVGLPLEASLEKRRWLSSSANVCITADGDMPEYWLRTGRAYLRMSLEIENAGLSQATSAAAVEASTFHEDVEVLLGTEHRLQAVTRIGAGANKRHYSPRLSAQELIVT